MVTNIGYKNTDIGVIPKDWDCIHLCTLGKLLSGLTYTPEDVKNYGLLVLRSSNIQEGRLCFKDNVYVNCKIEADKYVKQGDLLICVRNGSRALIGKCALIDKNYNATFGAFMALFRSPHGKYLYQLFSNNTIQEQINRNCGATINQITSADFNRFLVAFPQNPKEQAAISEALSDVDNLTSSLQKLIEKKKAIKQGAMQELLTGKKRLPGFFEEWNEGCIGDYCQCIRGVSYNGGTDLFPDENSYSFRLLRANNIQNGSFVPNDVQFVKKSCVSEEQVLHINDILVCMANGSKPLVGKNCFLNVRNGVYTFGAFMGCIRARTPSTCMKYIFQIMNSTTYWENISLLLSGSSINNLRPNDILNMTYKFPTAIEQQAIAQVLSDMDSEIEKLEKKLAKYQQIKQGMMQELLTGRIRLKEGENNA